MQRFDAFNKKSYFCRPYWISKSNMAHKNMPQKKCSTLTNWHTSDLDSAHIDRKQQKNIIYVEKQGCVTSSPDY